MAPLRRNFVLSATSASGPFPEFEPPLAAEIPAVAANDHYAPPAWQNTVSSSPFAAFLYACRKVTKRFFDYTSSFLLLIALSPLMLMIAAIIRLESPGPSLFTQERVGFGQRIFKCYKFRSMYHHMSEPCGTTQATRGDVRVTPFGRFLRRSSLDELPQLLNVLKGEMSMVGPRPHAPNTRAAGCLFADIVPNYADRHCVRPGITGWAQVNGWRGETRSHEDIQMRVRYDMDYIRNWSLLFDVRIMLLTLVRMLHDDTAV